MNVMCMLHVATQWGVLNVLVSLDSLGTAGHAVSYAAISLSVHHYFIISTVCTSVS